MSHTVLSHETGELIGISGAGISLNFGIGALNWSSEVVPLLYSASASVRCEGGSAWVWHDGMMSNFVQWSRNSESAELVAYLTVITFLLVFYYSSQICDTHCRKWNRTYRWNVLGLLYVSTSWPRIRSEISRTPTSYDDLYLLAYHSPGNAASPLL